MKPVRLLPLVLAAAGMALSACGSLGELERPEDPAKRAELAAERRAVAAKGNQASNPRSDEELIDPATSRGNTRESQIGGAPNDPFAGPGADPR